MPTPLALTPQSSRASAFLKALFAVTVWGVSFIATKVALRDISPSTLVWLRFAFGIVVLACAVAARRELARVPPADLAYLALLGFLGITWHQWLQSNGLVTADASTTAWIVASTPVFIALLGKLVLKERIGWSRLLGIAIAAFGVMLVVSKGHLTNIASGRIGRGDLLVMLSAPNWAVFSVLSRRGLARHPAGRMMLYVMVWGWVFTSILFLAQHGAGEIAHLTRDGWLAVLFLGVFCSGLAFVFWYDALAALPTSQVGGFLYIEPLVTAVGAAIVLSESLRVATFLGGALILAGVWLINSRQGTE
jgi:drug/metabolite transporter (DMT)-like permease